MANLLPARIGFSSEARADTEDQMQTAHLSNTPAQMDQLDKSVVYYDGACPLCQAEIGYYSKQPGADSIEFINVAAAELNPAPDLDRQVAMRRFHVRRSDGQLLSGAAAFVHVWSQLPRWQWAARMARLPGLLPLMELTYRCFLYVRPILSWAVSKIWRDQRARP